MAASIKRVTYNGPDAQVDQFARNVSEIMKFMQSSAAIDGSLFEEQDFGEQTAPITRYLKHTMKRKARGVAVFSCRPRKTDAPACPAGIPVHLKTLDDDNAATIYLTAEMATNFIWTFWVW
jgi:hypothetical protein